MLCGANPLPWTTRLSDMTCTLTPWVRRCYRTVRYQHITSGGRAVGMAQTGEGRLPACHTARGDTMALLAMIRAVMGLPFDPNPRASDFSTDALVSLMRRRVLPNARLHDFPAATAAYRATSQPAHPAPRPRSRVPSGRIDDTSAAVRLAPATDDGSGSWASISVGAASTLPAVAEERDEDPPTTLANERRNWLARDHIALSAPAPAPRALTQAPAAAAGYDSKAIFGSVLRVMSEERGWGTVETVQEEEEEEEGEEEVDPYDGDLMAEFFDQEEEFNRVLAPLEMPKEIPGHSLGLNRSQQEPPDDAAAGGWRRWMSCLWCGRGRDRAEREPAPERNDVEPTVLEDLPDRILLQL